MWGRFSHASSKSLAAKKTVASAKGCGLSLSIRQLHFPLQDMAHFFWVAGASFKVRPSLPNTAKRPPACALITMPAVVYSWGIDQCGIVDAAFAWFSGGVERYDMVGVSHGDPLGIKADAKGIQQACKTCGFASGVLMGKALLGQLNGSTTQGFWRKGHRRATRHS